MIKYGQDGVLWYSSWPDRYNPNSSRAVPSLKRLTGYDNSSLQKLIKQRIIEYKLKQTLIYDTPTESEPHSTQSPIFSVITITHFWSILDIPTTYILWITIILSYRSREKHVASTSRLARLDIYRGQRVQSTRRTFLNAHFRSYPKPPPRY